MPRMIDLIRVSAVPSNLMQAAARGALSVPPAEIIEILVHLAKHNKVFGEQARLTLAGWDEAASRAAASDPSTPKEVLDYMVSRETLRPCLLPALLENPAVSEDALVELAATGSREIVESLLRSVRAKQSLAIMNALASNSHLTSTESAEISQTLTALGIQAAAPASEEVLPADLSAESTDPEEVLDEGLAAYLAEHAAEISAEEGKPFQPIGGILEELELAPEEPAEVLDGPASPAAPAATAAKAKPGAKPAHAHPGEEKRGSTLQKIASLDIKGRIQLAMKGTKEERSILIRDGTKVVALAVLESPKITDAEVESFAGQKNVLEAVLRAIPMKRRFMKHYSVVRNLVFNPRTPLDVALGLMKHMLVNDLRNLSANKEVSDTVRKLALKMFKQKLDAGKSKSG